MSNQQNEQVRNVLQQLETQYNEARKALSITSQTLAGRERERRANVLTLREIEALPRGGKEAPTCYKGVGRMFMQESRNNIENTLKGREKEIAEAVNVLAKKAKYLQGEMATAEGSLRDLMRTSQ
ncbi:prefoldin subunit 1, partial [Phenoliferia sp. Uapishka_3]